jgi:hypothetical protein
MTSYEYDEEASERHHMDVVSEVDGTPAPVGRWVDAMRRLNTINDPLAAAFWRCIGIADRAAVSATPSMKKACP